MLLTTPTFGEPLPITASPETLAFLGARRSASAMTLQAPGPNETELQTLLSIAARAPDHGKLAPWRFVVLSGQGKEMFVTGLEVVAARRPESGLSAKLGKLRVPPIAVAVISRHIVGKIPEWEQRLSAGAVCTLLIIAAQAMGYGANWITDWYAYDPEALALLGATGEEQVAGFVYLGTPTEAPLERVRPDMEAIVETWARASPF
jgi:nitroreductase